MGVFGDYVYPAEVVNDTSDLTLIVVDGIAEPPTFSTVGPGAKSTNHSIDAFGAYRGDQPCPIGFKDSYSEWWKVPDGTKCNVSPDTASGYRLMAVRGILNPSPSNADAWGCTPAQIQLLLHPPTGS